MALLDRNGVYGSARFHTSAKTKRRSRACRSGDRRVELRPAADASGMAAAPASPRACASAVAVRVARGLSESLPAHHAIQDAGGNKKRGCGDFR